MDRLNQIKNDQKINEPLTIYIRSLMGQTFTLSVFPYTTGSEILSHLGGGRNIIFNKKLFLPTTTISEMGIRDGDTLHINKF